MHARSSLRLALALPVAALLAGCPSGNTNGTTPTNGAGGNGEPATTTPIEAAIKLPSNWFNTDLSAWIGKPWSDVDLIQFMPTKPSALDSGTRYVVFYRRSCDHCEDMFNVDFVMNPTLAAEVTAVEVPEDKTTMRAPNAWAVPDTEVAEHLELPLGCNWIMTTPLTIKIVNGVVTCATEGDHKECMGLE